MLFTINGFRINDFKATNCVKAQWKQATTNAKSFETRISKYILPWRDVRIVQRRVHIPSRLSMICHCKNVNFRYCFSKLLLNLCIVKNLLIKCGLKFPSAKVSCKRRSVLAIHLEEPYSSPVSDEQKSTEYTVVSRNHIELLHIKTIWFFIIQ